MALCREHSALPHVSMKGLKKGGGTLPCHSKQLREEAGREDRAEHRRIGSIEENQISHRGLASDQIIWLRLWAELDFRSLLDLKPKLDLVESLWSWAQSYFWDVLMSRHGIHGGSGPCVIIAIYLTCWTQDIVSFFVCFFGKHSQQIRWLKSFGLFSY